VLVGAGHDEAVQAQVLQAGAQGGGALGALGRVGGFGEGLQHDGDLARPKRLRISDAGAMFGVKLLLQRRAAIAFSALHPRCRTSPEHGNLDARSGIAVPEQAILAGLEPRARPHSTGALRRWF
jgi:hypothetical protein